MKTITISFLAAGLLLFSCIGMVSAFSGTDETDALSDPDRDGLTNVEEYQAGTDPGNPDTDNDGLPDGWEFDYGLNPLDPTDAHNDEDYSGGEEYSWFDYVPGPHYDNYDEYYRLVYVHNNIEYFIHSNPTSPDSDGDGSLDPDDPWPTVRCDCQYGGGRPPRDQTNEEFVEYMETHLHDDPVETPLDTDKDGLNDDEELFMGCDPENPDTDGDLLLDGNELILGLDPNDWDTDNDLLADGSELGHSYSSTDGHLVDTDSDGIL